MSALPRRVLMAENLVWDTGVRVGSHHYARCITEVWGAEALWVALPWTPAHLASRGIAARQRRQSWRGGRGTRPLSKLQVLSPLSLWQFRNTPGFRSAGAARLALSLTLPGIGGQLRSLGYAAPDVLWITDPRHVDLLRYVAPKRIVYRCPDHFAHFSDIPPAVEQLERRLIARADVVTASSRALVEHLDALGARTLYVPNGVDADRFLGAAPGARLDAFARPRILYAGAMGEWFDVQGVAALAAARPHYQVILAGPVRTDIAPLLALPNVVHLGALPYEEMPGLMAAADVGLVPFRRGGIGAAVNPIKMFEYLAAGLPVVMTGIGDLGGVEEGEGVVLAGDERAFVDAVDAAVAEKARAETAPRLRDVARRHSWRARFRRISAALGWEVPA